MTNYAIIDDIGPTRATVLSLGSFEAMTARHKRVHTTRDGCSSAKVIHVAHGTVIGERVWLWL